MEQLNSKKPDTPICHIKEHNLPFTFLCIDGNCQANRISCKTCIRDNHKNHPKNSFIPILDLLNENSEKHVLKNWPNDEFIRTIGELIYPSKEPQNEPDFMDKKLENEIENLFNQIYHRIKEKLYEIKTLVRCKFLNKPIGTEIKLSKLRQLYDNAFGLDDIRECLLKLSENKITLIQTEIMIQEFFHRDRLDIIEKIQFLYNSLKSELTINVGHNDNTNIRIQKKVFNLNINEKLYEEFMEKIQSNIKVESILNFANLKPTMKPLQIPENTTPESDFWQNFASVYAKMDDISPICEIKNAHSEDISNLILVARKNVTNNTVENIVVSTSDDKSIKIWDINKKKLIKTIPKAHNDWILSILVFELTEKEKLFLETEISHIIATGSADGNIKLWTLDDAKFIIEIKEAHQGWIYNMEILPVDNDNMAEAGYNNPMPTSSLIVSTSTDKFIKIWDWITCECLKCISTNIKSTPLTIIPYKRGQMGLISPNNVNSPTYNEISNELSGTMNALNIEPQTNKSLSNIPCINEKRGSNSTYTDLNHNSSKFLTPTRDSNPHPTIIPTPVSNRSNANNSKILNQTFSSACYLNTSSKKYLIANAGWDSSYIKVWDWTKSKLVSEMKGRCSRYSCLACLPIEDDHPINKKNQNQSTYLLAAAGLGPTGHCIEIWDFWEKKCIKVISEAHSDWIKSLRIIPSRRKDSTIKKMYLEWLIVTGSNDRSIKFWDWYNADKIKEFSKEYPINRNGALRAGTIATNEGSRLIMLSSGGDDANKIIIFGEDDILL